MATKNFGLSDSLIEAARKVRADAQAKLAETAADREKEAETRLKDDTDRIKKYSQEVFGLLNEEELDEVNRSYVGKDGFVHTPLTGKAPQYKSIRNRRKKKEKEKKEESQPDWKHYPPYNEEVEPEEQLDELSKKSVAGYYRKSKADELDRAQKIPISKWTGDRQMKNRSAGQDIALKKLRAGGVKGLKMDSKGKAKIKAEGVEPEELTEGRYIGGTFKTGEGARKRAAFENAHSNFKHRVVTFKGDQPHTGAFNRDEFKDYTYKIERYAKKTLKEEVDQVEEGMKKRILEKVMALRNKEKE
jgi:hypothetical protein